MSQDPRVRVMIVDDSSTVRGFLRKWIASDPNLAFVGEAEDGSVAIKKLKEFAPQVVVLDVEMPIMSGLETLRQIKAIDPTIQVVMFSTLTESGALVTLDALSLGAADYLAKPTSVSSAGAGLLAETRRDLVEKVTALGRRRFSRIAATMVPQTFSSRTAFESSRAAAARRGEATPEEICEVAAQPEAPISEAVEERLNQAPPFARRVGPSPKFTPATSQKKSVSDRFRIQSSPSVAPKLSIGRGVPSRPAGAQKPQLVLVGVSTGGPVALMEFLPTLAADFPLPVLVVQHMPAVFTRLLADRLDQKCSLHVVEAKDGEPLRSGTVYIAPGEHHLQVQREPRGLVASLTDSPPVNSCRPSADVLFDSAVAAVGGAILAVVMTGMGSDGAKGAVGIANAGGEVIVQDEHTSVVWGMPGAVVSSGVQSGIFPLDLLGSEVQKRIGRGRTGRSTLVGVDGSL